MSPRRARRHVRSKPAAACLSAALVAASVTVRPDPSCRQPAFEGWGTRLGPDGQPTGGRQEGAHAGPALQQSVVLALREAMDASAQDARLSAMDETSPTLSPATGPGLGVAERIVDDVRELEPSEWSLWQAIADYNPQAAAGKNWGAIQVPFDRPADATPVTCPIRANTNVHVDSTDQRSAVALDLPRFGAVRANASVTPVVGDADGGLVRGRSVRVEEDRSATPTAPAKSVTPFVVKGVRGVAADAALVRPGHVYALNGVQRGKALGPSADGRSVVLGAAGQADADARWLIEPVTAGVGDRERHAVRHDDGKRLADRDGGLVLEAGARTDPAAQWIMSTTGDGTCTFVNASTGRLFDVVGQGTGVGTRVGVYAPDSGSNQRWAVVDRTPHAG